MYVRGPGIRIVSGEVPLKIIRGIDGPDVPIEEKTNVSTINCSGANIDNPIFYNQYPLGIRVIPGKRSLDHLEMHRDVARDGLIVIGIFTIEILIRNGIEGNIG